MVPVVTLADRSRPRAGSTAETRPIALAIALRTAMRARSWADPAGQDPAWMDNPDTWTVLRDPEGNEFCVTSTATLTGWD
jgi:hypothetical protein